MSLELKKLELQLAQVAVARQANEVRVLELMENIDRINNDIQLSKNKEQEIEKLIKERKGK